MLFIRDRGQPPLVTSAGANESSATLGGSLRLPTTAPGFSLAVEGMKIARDKGKLRGKPPKLSDLQQRELLKMHATGEYSISDLGKLIKVSRPTVYRTIRRDREFTRLTSAT